MARPIKETPILVGEDARRFELAMANVKPLSQSELNQIRSDYEDVMKMMDRGENIKFPVRNVKS